MELTVICVYHQGKFRTRHYSAKWVERLRMNVSRHLHIPYRFVCLSNAEVACDKIPLRHDYPGWWSKIELFRDDLPGDRFLYLDLDTLVLQDLQPLVEMEGKFIGTDPSLSNPKKLMESCRTPYIHSGVMVWDRDYVNVIYDSFTTPQRVERDFATDQDFIGKVLVDHKIRFHTFPRQWIQLLRDVRLKKAVPQDCVVLNCSPNGWRQDIVVQEKGEAYKWVEQLWKGEKVS